MMPKRKCTFNISLQQKYPFIKQRKDDTAVVTCEKCRTDFSVGHGGASDIEKHLKSEKHRLADQAAASSSSMLSFYKRTNLPISKAINIAAAKGTWAFHTVQDNHSFRSEVCSSPLIQLSYEKYGRLRTKSQTIVVDVLSTMATEELKEHLRKANCITLLTDVSNHGSIQLFPVLIRYFLPHEGVKVKVLEFREQPGETSDIVVDYLKEVLYLNDLNKKIVAFCGDNANCNFGAMNRRGSNNVYSKLNKSLGRQLIGIGCGARIVHNAFKTAADCLPVDFECIIVKIYSFFYIYSVRVEALKEFCDYTETEYHKLLCYSKTRWLAFMPALERVIKMFQPLKKYFLSIDKCPNILKKFFENPSSKLWLYFLHAQAVIFHEAVLKIEGQNVSAIESAKEINRLRDDLALKENAIFLPHTVRNLLAKLLEREAAVNQQYVKTAAAEFYKTSKEYLEQWCQFNTELEVFEWANLTKVPTWEEVQKVLDLLITQGFISSSQESKIFYEFSLISNFATDAKISDWNAENVSTETRWVELFQHFRTNNLHLINFSTIIEYVMCLPGSNAPVERVFYQMNKISTSDKTLMKAIVITRINIDKSCSELHTYLKTRPDILKQICLAEHKYNPLIREV